MFFNASLSIKTSYDDQQVQIELLNKANCIFVHACVCVLYCVCIHKIPGKIHCVSEPALKKDSHFTDSPVDLHSPGSILNIV